jgi:putative endonuclease
MIPIVESDRFAVDGRVKASLTRQSTLKVRMFYVYVLRSKKDSGLYTGYSADLRRRVALHKQGDARATASRGPWELIYYEAYVEQADALGRERFLKSGSGRRFLGKQLVHYLVKHPIRRNASPRSVP